MNAINHSNTLRSELAKSLSSLEKLEGFLEEHIAACRAEGGRNIVNAMAFAQALANYYTCAETVFLRISRFFENNLPAERWHQELLEKMTLEIDGVRQAVIDDATQKHLLEILKFRHFCRYYFDMEYDWDKIDFLTKKFEQVRIPLKSGIADFAEFLKRLECAHADD